MFCGQEKGEPDITSISLHISEAGLQSPEEHHAFSHLAGLLRSVQVMVALPFLSASC